MAAAIGLCIGLAPGLVQAQTNIDQGKSPAEIFATVCTTCHKSARGLASGRGSFGLASFLVEHYTASKDQASALAAYVIGAGGGETSPAARGPKPPADRNRASAEEPKPVQPPNRPGQASPARPSGGIPTIVQEPSAGASDRRPATARLAPQPATPNHDRRKEPETTSPAQQPAAMVAVPAPPASSVQETTPAAVPAQSAAAPASADSGENAPVPRDNIPD